MSSLSMNVPPEILEKRAAEQRRSLHNRVQELRTMVTERVREKTDVKRNVRRHFGPLAGIAAVVGLSLGWGLTGIFVD
jgi:hypothetical protein